MNSFFTKRRDRILTYRAMREGKLAAAQHTSCPNCHVSLSASDWIACWQVCPSCGFHAQIGAHDRLSLLLDAGSFQEIGAKIEASDPLRFPGYREKLAQTARRTGLSEAAVTAVGTIRGQKAVVAVLDSRFFMGSMGTTVGEKITRAVEYADQKELPLIIFSASGGARMQEGIFSLMQMAKTSAAIQRFQSRGGLYLSCLTHPTTGGVTASFASLGDIMLAEPNALIGFAGPRVIEQTIGETLPEGFQRAEYLLEHGFLDQIVPRRQWPDVLGQLLSLHEKRRRHGKLHR